MIFQDRRDAGRKLAELLLDTRDENPLILALPRGGVEVGFEVARRLAAPLDVLVARKIGAPWQPELGIGAVAPGGVLLLDEATTSALGIRQEEIEPIVARETAEMERRLKRYRGDRPYPDLADRTVIVVDDGLATGVTARAALEAVRRMRPRRRILAVPVAAADTVERLRHDGEEVICVLMPRDFRAVGYWYAQFEQTDDETVIQLLESPRDLPERAGMAPPERWEVGPSARGVTTDSPGSKEAVAIAGTRIPAGGVDLAGDLVIPPVPAGIVVFAHGSGSSRFSARNRRVARALNEHGFATLLLDLLTPEEEDLDRATGEYRFDIERLAERLRHAVLWMGERPDTRRLPIGIFGASTGGGAALVAAARSPAAIRAVVSRGGRPDLAGPALSGVEAPTLLIVGGSDPAVLTLNRGAMEQLRCEKELAVVPGATHLFEEPGALEAVSRLAIDWFQKHFAAGEKLQGGEPQVRRGETES